MKKVIIIISSVLVLFVVAIIGLFKYSHPTHYSFYDGYVIGKPIQKIIDRYGEPYRTTENTITYKIRDNTPEWIMSKDDSLWYVIVFENDAAVEVYLREGNIGG